MTSRRMVPPLLLLFAAAIGSFICRPASEPAPPPAVQVLGHGRLTSTGHQYRHLRVRSGQDWFEVHALVLDRPRLRLVPGPLDTPDAILPGTFAADAVAMINAGFFDHAGDPVGLLRVEDRELSAPLRPSPLSGVVALDARGRVALVPLELDPPDAPDAFQTGPFLIDPGGTMGIRTPGGDPARRSFIAVAGPDRVILGATTGTTLYDLARFLSHPAALGVQRIDAALNLDGGPSTLFAADLEADDVRIAPTGPLAGALLVLSGSADAPETHP